MSIERRTPVQAVRVERSCDEANCSGMLEYAGESSTLGSTWHKHQCTACRITSWIEGQRYPYVTHEVAPSRCLHGNTPITCAICISDIADLARQELGLGSRRQ